MKISLLPKTKAGKGSIWAMIIFFLSLIARKIIFTSSYPPVGRNFFNPPMIGILMIAAWIAGFTAFITGIFSVIMRKERSVFVFLTMLTGLFIFLFGFGELLYPH